jgi:hypothetical protein
MYVHIGPNKAVRKEDIISVFDLDSSTVSVYTREFLKNAEKEKRVVLLSYDLPKSFILMRDETIYLSPFNTSTIYK